MVGALQVLPEGWGFVIWFGGGGEGTGRSVFPASRTLNSRFPPPSLVVPASVCFFLLQNIVQCCKIHFLFLPNPAPLGIPSPALSSPTSCTLPAPGSLPGSLSTGFWHHIVLHHSTIPCSTQEFKWVPENCYPIVVKPDKILGGGYWLPQGGGGTVRLCSEDQTPTFFSFW